MSGLPTLLRKGFIVPPPGTSRADADRISNMVSIDYVLGLIAPKIPMKRGIAAKAHARSPGDLVFVFKSETGSGKSTVLPPKLYNTFFERTRKNIVVTQPRVFTAMDTPSIITQFEPELFLDKNIGYSTQQFKRLPSERGIIFCTIGVLTQQLIMNTDEEFMRRNQFIVIDEVHERDIETDLCLFYLKKLLEANYDNPECPVVILMSATFNESIFIDYFGVPARNFIKIVGSTFPIEQHFPKYSIANYMEYATLKAQKIHLDNLAELQGEGERFRDIIIFVKGADVGKKIYEKMMVFNSRVLDEKYEKMIKHGADIDAAIERHYKKGGAGGKAAAAIEHKNYYILPIFLDKQSFDSGGLEYQNLFSEMQSINVPLWALDERGGIDMKQPPRRYVQPTRRVIIATNIAETGVTIPTLKYCIDTGYHFNVEFNPDAGCKVMYAKNVTRSSAIQRRGRVGRLAPGHWYPCYTEATFNAMPEDQFAKIIISDTTENILGILIKEKQTEIVEEVAVGKIADYKKEKLFRMYKMTSRDWYVVKNPLPSNLASLDFIELPSMQTLSYSTEKLHMLGFIDDNYDITATGFIANKIRYISLELRKMIMAGYAHGASILDLVTIAAFVYVERRLIFGKKFAMKNFIKQNDTDFEFYNRILFADDFINCVFVWNTFQKFLQKGLAEVNIEEVERLGNRETTRHKKIMYTDMIEKWCAENGVLYGGLLSVIRCRDQFIENLILVGLDPYKNSLDVEKSAYNLNKIVTASLAEGLEEIRKIKCCIYEGFKCNVLARRGGKYVSLLRNTPINIQSIYTAPLDETKVEQTRPMYIAVDSYMLSQKFGSAQFEFVASGYVSVLDNYVNVDEHFHMR